MTAGQLALELSVFFLHPLFTAEHLGRSMEFQTMPGLPWAMWPPTEKEKANTPALRAEKSSRPTSLLVGAVSSPPTRVETKLAVSPT